VTVAVRITTLLEPFPSGHRLCDAKWKLQLHSFSSQGRIPGLQRGIHTWKRRMKTHLQGGGFIIFLSLVLLLSGIRNVWAHVTHHSFHSDASDAARAASVMVDYPYPSSPAHAKVLRVVHCSLANQLCSNVPCMHVAHRVSCPRSRASSIPERRTGRQRRNKLHRSSDGACPGRLQ
jgi:hypothetical protein